MASQKLSELTAVTSTADESLVYVADTQDGGSNFSGRKITVSNLLQSVQPVAGGDGIDVTGGTATVDLTEAVVSGDRVILSNQGDSQYDGTYQRLTQILGQVFSNAFVSGIHGAWYKDAGGGNSHVLFYDADNGSKWRIGTTSQDPTAWTANESIAGDFSTIVDLDVANNTLATDIDPTAGSLFVPFESVPANVEIPESGYPYMSFDAGKLQVEVLDEDDLVSDSNQHLPTQQSVKAYVDSGLANKADLSGGVIPSSQLPSLAITEYLGDVADQAAMLATSGERGDWVTRQDTGTTFIQTADDGSLIGSWVEIATPTDAVSSVNGNTGTVVLSAADVGLGNVDNTSDADKPISTATQSALDLKAADADVLKKDGSVALTGDLPAGGNTVSGLAAPLAGSDAATKAYVDSATSGQGAFFETVRLEAIGNITLSGDQLVDGIQPVNGDRILVEAQTNTAENGIYVFNDAGAWTRAGDADEASEFVLNKTVYISEGNTHAGDVYALTTVPTTLDSDPVVFTKKQDSAGIVDGSITTVKLAADAVTVDKIADGINVNHFDASTTPDAEPATFYFLAVDAATGEIKVLDKSFVEID